MGGVGMRWWRPVLLVVLAAAAMTVAVTVGVPPIEEIRAWVTAAGWAGPALYAALYAGLSLTPIPASVLNVGAGALFGVAVGVPVALAGAIAGAVAGFALARHLGRTTVEGIGGAGLTRLDGMVRRNGLPAMAAIRLAPTVPFAILNMACGLTGVRTRDYVLGSAIGMVPGAAAFVAIGAYGAEPTSTPFLLSLAGLAVVVTAGALVARRRRAAAVSGLGPRPQSSSWSRCFAPRSAHSRSAFSAASVRSRAISRARAAVSRSG